MSPRKNSYSARATILFPDFRRTSAFFRATLLCFLSRNSEHGPSRSNAAVHRLRIRRISPGTAPPLPITNQNLYFNWTCAKNTYAEKLNVMRRYITYTAVTVSWSPMISKNPKRNGMAVIVWMYWTPR